MRVGGPSVADKRSVLAFASIVTGGLALTTAIAFGVFDNHSHALLAIVLTEIGPVWALAFCLVSSDEDVVRAGRSRSEWLRLLPWTFLFAPLALPNLVLLTSFFRDSRADTGRTVWGSGRDRPKDPRFDDHHWPEDP